MHRISRKSWQTIFIKRNEIGIAPRKQCRKKISKINYEICWKNNSILIKNIAKAEVLRLADQVEYQDGQIVSKTLAQNDAVSLTLFAFEKGEEISTHAAGGDAMVTVLEGTGRFTIDGKPHVLTGGQSIVMPVNIPHAVYGEERFKMLLTVVF